MSQTRYASFCESLATVCAGFVISVAVTAVVLPAYGLPVSLSTNAEITAIYTVISVARSYAMRRLFNHINNSEPKP